MARAGVIIKNFIRFSECLPCSDSILNTGRSGFLTLRLTIVKPECFVHWEGSWGLYRGLYRGLYYPKGHLPKVYCHLDQVLSNE